MAAGGGRLRRALRAPVEAPAAEVEAVRGLCRGKQAADGADAAAAVVSEGRGGGGVETVADARVLEGFRGTAGNRTRGLSHPKRESYL